MLPVGHRARRAPDASARPTVASGRADFVVLPGGRDQLAPPTQGPARSAADRFDVQLVQMLKGRETSRLRATVDLAITQSGVWLLHSRPGRGAVATRKPLLSDATLTIAGRDRSDLVADLDRQRASVEGALLPLPEAIPVRAAIYFVDAKRPHARVVDVGPKLIFGFAELDAVLRAPGPCHAELASQLAGVLDEAFPAAA